jgi:hypothetical protein
MTETAAAAAPAIGVTDLLNAPAAPAAKPVYMPEGFPVTPPSFNSPEALAARETIETRKADREFGKKLLAKDPAATAEWVGLHKAGYPAPQQVASAEDVNAQEAARSAEQWNKFFGWMRQSFNLTPEMEAELQGGVIRADLHQLAKEEKDRMIADRDWRKRYFDGDRKAREEWSRITLALSLKPVKPTT